MKAPEVSPSSTPVARSATVIAALAVMLVVAIFLRLYVGAVDHSWPDGSVIDALRSVFFAQWVDEYTLTLMDIRLRRVVLAVIVGAALASSGVGLQALLRNPLAEPFILGLSSGAAVGVMVQTLVRGVGAGHVGSLCGALLSMAVVYAVGRRRGVIDPLGLLLVGVVLSTINSAVIMVLYTFYPPGVTNDTLRWMMGFLNEGIGSNNILIVTAVTAGGIGILLRLAPAMDAASFSDAEAQSLGVNLPVVRRWIFFVTGVLAAGAVVLSGPIAFVGLVCPHVARLLLGPRHRTLIIGAVLIGATLIVCADAAAVAIDAASAKVTRMPIGIFTAAIGGPAFLWMLRPYLGRGME